jgi:hypothetical protein
VVELGPVGPGQSYLGPSFGETALNSCECSTVVYSLKSACGACQGGSWITYVAHQPLTYWAYIFLVGLTISRTALPPLFTHCELTVMTRGSLVLTENHTPSYVGPVPNGTSVPYWALINVTVRYSSFIFRVVTVAYWLYIPGRGHLESK